MSWLWWYSLTCGGIAAIIGAHRNLSRLGSFVWGFLLGAIGILIVCLAKPGLPPAPEGMRAAKCKRCNTVQNVPLGAPGPTGCYVCKTPIGEEI